jgi:hypothetical protein
MRQAFLRREVENPQKCGNVDAGVHGFLCFLDKCSVKAREADRGLHLLKCYLERKGRRTDGIGKSSRQLSRNCKTWRICCYE